MQLTCDEIMDILDIKYPPSKRTGYILPAGLYEKRDINKTLEFSIPDDVKVTITIDDIRTKSNLYNCQTSIFTKKPFFIQF